MNAGGNGANEFATNVRVSAELKDALPFIIGQAKRTWVNNTTENVVCLQVGGKDWKSLPTVYEGVKVVTVNTRDIYLLTRFSPINEVVG